MLCPSCGVDRDKVIDSRSSEGGRVIRRRRVCLQCERRFTTHERLEQSVKLIVVKKDGARVPYSRERILEGLEKALYKRPVSADQVRELVDSVEDQLLHHDDKEVPSVEIGRMVIERLRHVDQVAYVRYASVYKQFRDIEELYDEVKQIIAAPSPPTAPPSSDHEQLF